MTKVTLSRPIISPLSNALGASIAGRKGIGKHLQPGVVAYDNDDGTRTTYLLPLEAIEKMRPTAKDKPVVGKSGGFDHVKIKPGHQYDGVATDSFWDGQSGWEAFNFDGMNSDTAKACEKGYQVSCAYIPTEVDETPGLWHNVPYDAIILNGEYTHFAVVPNPRYEGATIELLNSIGGGIMNKVLKATLSLIPIKQLREVFNSIEEDEKKKESEKAAAEKKNADDKAAKKDAAKKTFDDCMLNAKTDEEKAAAQAAFQKANAEIDAAPAIEPTPVEPVADLPPQPLGGGDVTPEPGAPAPAGGAPAPALNAPPTPTETPEQAQEREKKAAEALALKNAADEKAKKEAEDKAELEKKNALELKNKAEKAAKIEAERIERFNALRRVAEERGGQTGTPFVGVVSEQEKESLGRDRYGSRK